NAEVKKAINEKMIQYLTRAEQLKEGLKSLKNPPPLTDSTKVLQKKKSTIEISPHATTFDFIYLCHIDILDMLNKQWKWQNKPLMLIMLGTMMKQLRNMTKFSHYFHKL